MKEFTKAEIGMSPEEACERQVAKEPWTKKVGMWQYFYCSRCGNVLNGLYRANYSYCSNCGQRIKKDVKDK